GAESLMLTLSRSAIAKISAVLSLRAPDSTFAYTVGEMVTSYSFCRRLLISSSVMPRSSLFRLNVRSRRVSALVISSSLMLQSYAVSAAVANRFLVRCPKLQDELDKMSGNAVSCHVVGKRR